MSVYNNTYKCPKCGHIEKQCYGMYLFGDKCYEMLQCPQCKKVDSMALSIEAIKRGDYALCEDCQAKMTIWRELCPECDTKMEIISSFSDVI